MPGIAGCAGQRWSNWGRDERGFVISARRTSAPKSGSDGMTQVGISESNLWVCFLLRNEALRSASMND